MILPVLKIPMMAIVIGSGIGGLATANRLRAEGFEVQIFEANRYAGGKLTAFTQGGYRFDAGPSLFTMPHFLDDVFMACGRNPRDYYQYKKLGVTCHYFYEDGTQLIAYADREKLAKEVSNKLHVPENIIRNYLDRSKMLYESAGRIFIEKPLQAWRTWLSKSVMKALLKIPKMGLFTSLNGFNEKHLKEPKLVQLFNRYATYNGSDPYQAPGILSTIPHLEFNVGTFLPEGGMHSITQALVKLANDQGVSILYDSPVDEIILKEGKAMGVLAKGKFYEADVVVSNMDVYFTWRRLLKNIPPPKRTLNQERSSSALIFYWGIKKTFKELSLHNIFFAADYRKEFDMLFNQKEVSDDPTIYINITSKQIASDAPEGCENWFVMINVPAIAGQGWDAVIVKARKNILEKLSRQLNTDVELLIENESILDPRAIENRTNSYRGALYGTSSNSRYAAFLRHANQCKQIPNLYFCGGSVHPGGGIPLCLQSAKITTELIAEHFA